MSTVEDTKSDNRSDNRSDKQGQPENRAPGKVVVEIAEDGIATLRLGTADEGVVTLTRERGGWREKS